MLARWSFTFIAAVMLALGIWRLLYPPEAKITLLPMAAKVSAFQQPPKTGTFQEPPPMVVAVYDVNDIVSVASRDLEDDGDAYPQLLEILEDHVAPRSWYRRDGHAQIYRMAGNHLIIVQTKEAHRQIADLLQAIRRADGLKWAWTAK